MSSTVLVTRPSGQNQALLQGLGDLGLDARELPLLQIEPLSQLSASSERAVRQFDQFKLVIFVSANAVTQGMPRLLQDWPELPPGLRWFCVGAASAEQLSEYVGEVAYPADNMSSEGLLALPELNASGGQKVLIVKGEGGRDYLRQQLQGRGAEVEQLAVYRRCLPEYDSARLRAAFDQPAPIAVLVNSGESLHNMVSLLTRVDLAGAFTSSLVVPGERVAAVARQLGFEDIQVAANATDGAMLAALQQRLAGEGTVGRI